MILRAPICDVKWLLMINVWKYVLVERKARKIPAQTLVNSLIFAFTFPLNASKAFIARAKGSPPNGVSFICLCFL